MTSTSEKLGQLDGTREDHECNRQQSPFRVVAKPEGHPGHSKDQKMLKMMGILVSGRRMGGTSDRTTMITAKLHPDILAALCNCKIASLC